MVTLFQKTHKDWAMEFVSERYLFKIAQAKIGSGEYITIILTDS